MKLDFTEKEIEFLIRAVVCNYAEQDSDFKGDISDNGPSNMVIGKLVGGSEHFENVYYDARKQRLAKDMVNKNVFMGNGWHSTVDVNTFHKRLTFAFCELSIIEQNGGMGTEFDEKLNDRNLKNIKDVLKDIVIAFDMIPQHLMDNK